VLRLPLAARRFLDRWVPGWARRPGSTSTSATFAMSLPDFTAARNHWRRARPGIACRTSFCWCGSTNCVNIRVKKEKLRDSVMRSAGGSGSNSASGLNTRLKNCGEAQEAATRRSRQHVSRSARQAAKACERERHFISKPPHVAPRGTTPQRQRRRAHMRSGRTATWRATAASNTGGNSKSEFTGCCLRPACRAISSFAPARAAA